MPAITEDRPIEAVREEVIDQLIMNYGHGQLSLDAFERRLEQAYDSSQHIDLANLTADLNMNVDNAYIEKKREDLGANYNTSGQHDTDYIVHIFGGGDRKGQWTAAKEIVVINIFGGGDLDFTDATFSNPTTKIKMCCIFGGSNIYVPNDVNVVTRAVCLFGGMDSRGNTIANKDAPTIVVEGLVLFGGVAIKTRTVLRERMMQFADGFRNMFSNDKNNERRASER